MDALFTFAISWSAGRPITPDQHTAWITIAGTDSPAGLLEARWTAIAMASGTRPNAMITRAELVDCEL